MFPTQEAIQEEGGVVSTIISGILFARFRIVKPINAKISFLVYDVTKKALFVETWSTIRKQAKRMPGIIVETTGG